MHARVVRFTGVTPERISEIVARIEDEDGPPPGVDPVGFELFVDGAQGTALLVGYFETEEKMREASAVFEQMDSSPRRRAAVPPSTCARSKKSRGSDKAPHQPPIWWYRNQTKHGAHRSLALPDVALSRAARLGQGHGGQDAVDDIVRRDAVGQRLVREHEAVAQDVGRELAHILRQRALAAADECQRPAGEDHVDRGAGLAPKVM